MFDGVSANRPSPVVVRVWLGAADDSISFWEFQTEIGLAQGKLSIGNHEVGRFHEVAIAPGQHVVWLSRRSSRLDVLIDPGPEPTRPRWTTVHRYTRDMIREDPDGLYLIGDNEARDGFGGQAREARGEPNALGIPTKRSPGRSYPDFWSDATLASNVAAIDYALKLVREELEGGRPIVVPAEGIGTSRAELHQRAPQTLAFLQRRLGELEQLANAMDGAGPPVLTRVG
jgi:hypothetical protein